MDSLAEGIPIECGEGKVERGETCAVDDHHLSPLVGSGEDLNDFFSGRRRMSVPGGNELVNKQEPEKLEWVDVAEHDEKQSCVDDDGCSIVQAVAAEEAEVRPPDHEKEAEADKERQKTQNEFVQLGVGLGDFERDDDECEGEAEDDVGKSVDARH